MKYIKLFENFKDIINIQGLKTWAYDYAQTNHIGHNSYDDAKWHLDSFFDGEIQELLKNKVKLFRVLEVEKKSDINKKKLGDHYLDSSYISRLNDRGWYESIGIDINSDNKLFLIEVETVPENINFQQTIINILDFPSEYEITLKNTPKILSIIEIDKNNIE